MKPSGVAERKRTTSKRFGKTLDERAWIPPALLPINPSGHRHISSRIRSSLVGSPFVVYTTGIDGKLVVTGSGDFLARQRGQP